MLLPTFWKTHKSSEIPFLLESRNHCIQHKPLKGVSILNNTPLSLETLIKVDCLIAAGANVTLTSTRFIKPNSENKTHNYIPYMSLRFIPKHEDLKPFKNDFDFVLDCGAELANIISPKKGIVELTGTGTSIFKEHIFNFNVPIISVDDSKTKKLETFFGTAEGFVRALEQFCPRDILDIHTVLFGYGKVGSGIVYGLSSYTKNITVIDKCDLSLEKANSSKLKAIHISHTNQIKQAVTKAGLIITAAGHPGLISTIFTKEELKGKMLANVSADDDFGKEIPEEDVLGKKQPLNFQLATPTLMRYLDPSFYAHNLCVELILKNTFHAGYHALPHEIDAQILQKWQKLHKEDISLIP